MPELKLFAIAAEDVLAISMVALVSFALGMIITILFVMARSGSERPPLDPDLSEQDEEGEDSRDGRLEAAGDPPSKDPPKEIWEKDPDWWRK